MSFSAPAVVELIDVVAFAHEKRAIKPRESTAAMNGLSLLGVFLSLYVGSSIQISPRLVSNCAKRDGSLYDLVTQDIWGRKIALSSFKHQVVLAVNVATFWDFTPQYYALNALTERYGGKIGDLCNLQVLAFPCNQFAHQEPGANATEIYNGLKYVRPGKGYVPKFEMLKKRDVNGKDEDEVYSFFKVNIQAGLLFYTWIERFHIRDSQKARLVNDRDQFTRISR